MMKTTMIIFASIMLFLLTGENAVYANQESTEKAVEIHYSDDLAAFSAQMGDLISSNTAAVVPVFSKIDEPIQKLEDDQGMYLLSENELVGLKNNDYWSMLIGRKIAVPVISDRNPAKEAFLSTGISEQILIQAMKNQGGMLETASGQKFQLLIESETQNIYPDTDEKLFATKDAIFRKLENNNTIALMNFESIVGADGSFSDQLQIIPVDYNADGKIGKVESFYNNPESFLRGVWLGKYPNSLCQGIFLAAENAPIEGSAKEIAKTFLGSGQEIMASIGFTGLVQSEIPSKLSSLNYIARHTQPIEESSSRAGIYLMLLGSLLVLFLVMEYFVRQNKKRKNMLIDDMKSAQQVFDLNNVETPKGILFDKTHTWTFMEKNGRVRVGIDDFLQHVTGRINRILLKDEGSRVLKGEALMTLVQNGKQLTVLSPLTGYVKKLNTLLSDDASIINDSPYEDGWVYMIEPENWSRERNFLTLPDNYTVWIKKEVSRFKDFIANVVNQNKDKTYSVVLQDGGELTDHVLSQMGPNVWEEFQNQFLQQ